MSQGHFSKFTLSNDLGAYRNLKRNLARRFASDPELLHGLQISQTLESIIEALALSYLSAFDIVQEDGAAGACDPVLRDHALDLAEGREDAIQAIMSFFDRHVIETPIVTVRLTGEGGIRIASVNQAPETEILAATS